MASARRSYRLDSKEILDALVNDVDSDIEEDPEIQIEGKLLYFIIVFLFKYTLFATYRFLLVFSLSRGNSRLTRGGIGPR